MIEVEKIEVLLFFVDSCRILDRFCRVSFLRDSVYKDVSLPF